MVLHCKRRLLLGLGLAMALGVVVALPATASAVSTLTGEHLSLSEGPLAIGCESGGRYSYTVSGTATGPYPGTFTETGSGTVSAPSPPPGPPGQATLSASFTIQSGNFLITGSKNGGSGPGCQDTSFSTGVVISGLSYQATIHTSTGNYADQGTSFASMFMDRFGTSLQEDFTSSLAQPVPTAPTSKDQCKKGGWKAFPQFRNQGQCVSFVARQRQN